MSLLTIIITLIVIGVVLWLINLIPMAASIKTIINILVVVLVVLWLLQIFGLIGYIGNIKLK